MDKTEEERAASDGGTTIEYWSGNRRLLYTPCSETDIYIALVMLDRDTAAKRVPIDKAEWTRSFPHLAALIDRIGEQGRYDRFEVIKLKRWSAGRVAVIGDAAHALPPNIGQGGGCAMMNALALAVYLDREADVPSALDVLGAQRAPPHRPYPAHFSAARPAGHLARGVAAAVPHRRRAARLDG